MIFALFFSPSTPKTCNAQYFRGLASWAVIFCAKFRTVHKLGPAPVGLSLALVSPVHRLIKQKKRKEKKNLPWPSSPSCPSSFLAATARRGGATRSQVFAGGEHPPGTPLPFPFPRRSLLSLSAVRNRASQTLSKLFLFEFESDPNTRIYIYPSAIVDPPQLLSHITICVLCRSTRTQEWGIGEQLQPCPWRPA